MRFAGGVGQMAHPMWPTTRRRILLLANYLGHTFEWSAKLCVCQRRDFQAKMRRLTLTTLTLGALLKLNQAKRSSRRMLYNIICT